MELAIVGLGRMGANMALRLLQGGHRVVVANRSRAPIEGLAAQGAVPAWEFDDVLEHLKKPRVVWLMLPAGDVTEEYLRFYAERLAADDLIVDGGNSFYKDSQRRAAYLREKGLRFVDVGTSGGVWGLAEGYSMMVGGDTESIARLRSALETLAPGADVGWGHVGPAGAGHFVKMVHNGIEYGLMEAYAEGFQIMKGKKEFGLDLYKIAEIWRTGSVVRSWLLDLIAAALKEDQTLSSIRGWVADSGEGRWTVAEAIEQDIAAPAITLSLLMRFISRREESFGDKLLAALRNQFGGHEVVLSAPARSDEGAKAVHPRGEMPKVEVQGGEPGA